MEKLFASFHLLQLWGLGMTTTVIRPFHSSVRFLHWKAKLRSKIVLQFFIIIHHHQWHPNIPRSQCSNKMSARRHPCSDDGLSLACYRHFKCFFLPSLQFPAPIIPPSLLLFSCSSGAMNHDVHIPQFNTFGNEPFLFSPEELLLILILTWWCCWELS